MTKVTLQSSENDHVFHKWCLDNWVNIWEKMKLEPISHHTKSQSQIYYRLKCKRQNNKAFR